MRKQYCLALGASLALLAAITVAAFIAAAAWHAPIPSQARPPAHLHADGYSVDVAGRVATVRGCRAEDSCVPAYHSDGRWTIRRVNP